MFGSFGLGMLTMWRVMIMDPFWIQFIYDEFNDTFWLAALFFITYSFFAGIVMTNVVIAILLEKYLEATDKYKESKQNEKIIHQTPRQKVAFMKAEIELYKEVLKAGKVQDDPVRRSEVHVLLSLREKELGLALDELAESSSFQVLIKEAQERLGGGKLKFGSMERVTGLKAVAGNVKGLAGKLIGAGANRIKPKHSNGSRTNSAAVGGSRSSSAADGGSRSNSAADGGSRSSSAAGGGSRSNSAADDGSRSNSAAGGGSRSNSAAGGGSRSNSAADDGSRSSSAAVGGSRSSSAADVGSRSSSAAVGGSSLRESGSSSDDSSREYGWEAHPTHPLANARRPRQILGTKKVSSVCNYPVSDQQQASLVSDQQQASLDSDHQVDVNGTGSSNAQEPKQMTKVVVPGGGRMGPSPISSRLPPLPLMDR
jgi:hypothetical protein